MSSFNNSTFNNSTNQNPYISLHWLFRWIHRRTLLPGLSVNHDPSMELVSSFVNRAKSTTRIIRRKRNPSPRTVLITDTDENHEIIARPLSQSQSQSQSHSHSHSPSSSTRGDRSNTKLPRTVLERFLFRLGFGETESSQVEAVLAEAGCDEEGKINLEDFLRPEISEEEELKEAFGVYDVNGDGVISPEELLQVLLTLEDGSCSITDCRRMIAVVDSDGDGFICFNDFKRMMSAG